MPVNNYILVLGFCIFLILHPTLHHIRGIVFDIIRANLSPLEKFNSRTKIFDLTMPKTRLLGDILAVIACSFDFTFIFCSFLRCYMHSPV